MSQVIKIPLRKAREVADEPTTRLIMRGGQLLDRQTDLPPIFDQPDGDCVLLSKEVFDKLYNGWFLNLNRCA